MIDHEAFTKVAISTESRVATIRFHRRTLIASLQMVIAAANILDLIKKNVFYGKVIDQEKLHTFRTQLFELSSGGTNFDTHPALAEDFAINTRLFHAIVGKATECGELVEALLKAILENTDIDITNFGEEIADDQWYTAIGLDEAKLTLQKVLEAVEKKLIARNRGKSFNAEATINRDAVAERKILDQELRQEEQTFLADLAAGLNDAIMEQDSLPTVQAVAIPNPGGMGFSITKADLTAPGPLPTGDGVTEVVSAQFAQEYDASAGTPAAKGSAE